jgi:phage protein D/phage baseplate assembly protein gpV
MHPLNEPFDIYVPSLSVAVGGRPLEPTVTRRVLRATVTQRLRPPDQFGLVFHDPQLELIDAAGGPLTEGAEVEIGLGYVDRVQKLITGRITALTAEFPGDGAPTLHVDGFDLLHDLARGTVHRSFEGSTPGSGQPDSQIATIIAQELGLTASVRQTPDRRTPRVQNHVSNLAFLQHLADLNGFALWVEGRTLHFKPERPAPKTAIRLVWGSTLHSFTPRLSTAGQVKAVEVRGWDPVQKQSFSARAGGAGSGLAATGRRELERGAGGRSLLVIEDAEVSSVKEAQALAERTLVDLRQTLTSGDGVSVGRPDIWVGSKLELRGLGRFSGSYAVTGVTHTLGEGGYQTSFEVNGAQGALDLLVGERAPDLGQVNGVVPGIVTANKDDDRRGRVRVKLPALDDQSEHWARLATLMAGRDRGSFFLPDKGDEVLVAFEQGDVGRPYVVGALWNGRDTQPDANADDGNNRRFIKSRSGHLIRLDDTDKAEKIEIIDKSGRSRLTLDTATDTVTIRSGKDVVVEAPNGAIRLKAARIELDATKDATVHASSTLELGGDGGLTIKGATVDIN